MLQKIIDLLSKQYEEVKQDNWENPEGKKIPYIRFSSFVMPENDDFNRYYKQVTVWPKTVSIEIARWCGECGPETENRWADCETFRISKVSHEEFLEKYAELLQTANRILYEKFQP